MEDTKKIYLSAMIPTELLDDDDDLTPSEVAGDHFVQYEFIDLIENIGKEEFKSTYLNFINDIRNQSLENQRTLCQHIIDKVQEVYEFEFPEKITIYDRSDIEDIYRFIEFLEYDNVDFFIEISKGLDIKSDIDLDEYKNKILNQIHDYNKINVPDIFNNLIITLEPNILLNIIDIMFVKNKELVLNELRIRQLQQVENKEE